MEQSRVEETWNREKQEQEGKSMEHGTPKQTTGEGHKNNGDYSSNSTAGTTTTDGAVMVVEDTTTEEETSMEMAVEEMATMDMEMATTDMEATETEMAEPTEQAATDLEEMVIVGHRYF